MNNFLKKLDMENHLKNDLKDYFELVEGSDARSLMASFAELYNEYFGPAKGKKVMRNN